MPQDRLLADPFADLVACCRSPAGSLCVTPTSPHGAGSSHRRQAFDPEESRSSSRCARCRGRRRTPRHARDVYARTGTHMDDSVMTSSANARGLQDPDRSARSHSHQIRYSWPLVRRAFAEV